MDQDVRWEQRFSNFLKALTKLKESVEYIKLHCSDSEELFDESGNYVLDELLKEGLIQRFEYTHELAWKVMKDYAEYQGNNSVGGSRDAVREAFQLKLVSNGAVWMEMIESRNKTSHTYNQATADEIFAKILEDYFPAFVAFGLVMEEKRSGKQASLFD